MEFLNLGMRFEKGKVNTLREILDRFKNITWNCTMKMRKGGATLGVGWEWLRMTRLEENETVMLTEEIREDEILMG